MKQSNQFFTTYDLNLSSTLLSLGFQIEKIERKCNRGLFFFQESPELNQKIDEYFKDQILVSPQSLFNSLKAIKNRLYSNWGGHG